MLRDAVEYVDFTLADRDGKDITTDFVQIALLEHMYDTPTWIDCTYVSGSTWRTSSAVTFSAANYPSWRYYVIAKLADAPETPRVLLGTLTVDS